MNKLTFRTSDDVPMEIDFEVIKCSSLIRNLIENLGFTDEEIPLTYVDHSTMQLIFEWADHHKEDPPIADDYEDTELDARNIPDWDKQFFNITQVQLFNLIKGASYLNIPKLSEYCYKSVASLIIGKTSAEILETFGMDTEEKEIEHESELPSSSGVETASNERKTEVQRSPKNVGRDLEFPSTSDEKPASKRRKTEAPEVSEEGSKQ